MSEKEEMLIVIDIFESLLDWGHGGYGDTEIRNMKKINQAIRSLIKNMKPDEIRKLVGEL